MSLFSVLQYSFKDENAALKALGIKVLAVQYIRTYVHVHTQKCTYIHLCMYQHKNVHM